MGDSFGRSIEIDLSSAVFPLQFAPLFAAKYPDDRRFLAQALSQRVYVVGEGTVTFIDGAGKNSVVTFALGDSRRDIEAVGINSVSGTFDAATVML